MKNCKKIFHQSILRKNERNLIRRNIDDILEKYPHSIFVSAYVCVFLDLYYIYLLYLCKSLNLRFYRVHPRIKVLLDSNTYIYLYIHYVYVYVFVCV